MEVLSPAIYHCLKLIYCFLVFCCFKSSRVLSKLAGIVSYFISNLVAWIVGRVGGLSPVLLLFLKFSVYLLHYSLVSILEVPHVENVSISDETYNLRHFFLCHSVFLSLTRQLKTRVKVLGQP